MLLLNSRLFYHQYMESLLCYGLKDSFRSVIAIRLFVYEHICCQNPTADTVGGGGRMRRVREGGRRGGRGRRRPGLGARLHLRYAFEPSAAQEDVYETCVRKLVEAALDGYNATVLAYGQVCFDVPFPLYFIDR